MENEAIPEWRQQSRARDLTVGDVMSTQMLMCSPETSVADAAARMSENRNSSILVHDGDSIVGIWTENDALRQELAPEGFETPIRDVMSKPVATIDQKTTVTDAAVQFKRQGFRHYVVVDSDGNACGLITQSDLVINHGVEWFMRLQPVHTALSGETPSVDANVSISEAAGRMYATGQDAVIVYDSSGTPGILTERDVVRYIGERQGHAAAWRMATRPITTVAHDASLFHARNLMLEHRFRHLGVVDANGALQNLIGFTAILETIEHGYIEELEVALAERDAALQASEERYRALVELSPDAIAVHRDHCILFINPAGAHLLGADDPQQVVGRYFDEFIHPYSAEDQSALAGLQHDNVSLPREERLTRLDGRRIDVELTARSIRYNDEPAWQVIMRNITRRKDLENELRRLATTDQLTGVHNRQHFESHLEQAVGESMRYGRPLALLMLDLDHFKRVNDAHGHDEGDVILQRVADRLNQSLRDTDILARWGGEEFMVLAPEVEAEGAKRLADKLRSCVQEVPVKGDGVITTSVGVAEHRADEDRQLLLKRVDNALYAAKSAGRDRIHVAE